MRHRLLRNDDADSERLYRWHIEQRTGGREPRSWKRSTDDYVTACCVLIDSMRAGGFDKGHPIRLGNNGALMDGAHRAACAILFGVRALSETVDKPGMAAPWGQEWLVSHGAPQADIARILADWNLLHEQARPGADTAIAGSCARVHAGLR